MTEFKKVGIKTNPKDYITWLESEHTFYKSIHRDFSIVLDRLMTHQREQVANFEHFVTSTETAEYTNPVASHDKDPFYLVQQCENLLRLITAHGNFILKEAMRFQSLPDSEQYLYVESAIPPEANKVVDKVAAVLEEAALALQQLQEKEKLRI